MAVMTPEYVKNKYKLDIALSSLKTYLTSLRKLGIMEEEDLHKLMSPLWLDKSIVFVVEESKRNLNSASNHIFAIAYFLKSIHGASGLEMTSHLYTNNCIQKILKDKRENLLDNTWSGGEAYKDVNLEELKETWLERWSKLEPVVECMLDGDAGSGRLGYSLIHLLQQYFLVSMYIFNMPLRNDYHRLKYVKTNAGAVGGKWEEYDGNMLVDYGATISIVIRKFKTMKKYKEIKFKLSPESTNVFYFIRRARGLKDGDDVIINRFGTYYSSGTTKLVSDSSKVLLGKDFSCNDYRHMYVINMLNSEEYKNMTIGEKMELANRMGHTYLTAQLYNRV